MPPCNNETVNFATDKKKEFTKRTEKNGKTKTNKRGACVSAAKLR